MSPENVQKILDFIQKVLPGVLLSIGIGYSISAKKIISLKKDLLDEKTSKALLENHLKVLSDTSDLSAMQLLARALRHGAELGASPNPGSSPDPVPGSTGLEPPKS